MANTSYNLWLLPAEPLRSELRSIIDRLATRYNSSGFEPHVTFFSGRSNDREITSVAKELCDRPFPIELKPVRFGYTRLFTKTFFIQFAECQPLREMYDHAVGACSHATEYELNPHLSLLYKTVHEDEQVRLCQALEMPDGPFLFDKFQAIAMETPFRTPEQIERCRTVYDSKAI